MAAAFTLKVEVTGREATQEFLLSFSKVGRKAQSEAIRDTGKKARSLAAKEIAAGLTVPQKIVRSRLKVFVVRDRGDLASGRLWLGLRHSPTAARHKKVEIAIKRQNPGSFTINRIFNRPGVMTRVGESLHEQGLEFGFTRSLLAMRDSVKTAMRETYPKRLRGQYRRLRDQEFRRSRRKR